MAHGGGFWGWKLGWGHGVGPRAPAWGGLITHQRGDGTPHATSPKASRGVPARSGPKARGRPTSHGRPEYHDPGNSLEERAVTTPKTPYSDPFLEEVHALKRDAFARSGNDLKRHIQRLREIEERYKDRLVPTLTKPVTSTE